MKIERGKKALTGQGFRHNIEVMKDAGYKDKRAQGMAYGEAGLAKRAMRHESEGMKRELRESPSTKHRRGEHR